MHLIVGLICVLEHAWAYCKLCLESMLEYWICLNMLELLFFLLYLFVDVKKGERKMNLSMGEKNESMGRSFLFDINAYIEGEHNVYWVNVYMHMFRGSFLIHLISVLSSLKRGRLLSPCLILMVSKHLCCYF